MRARQALLRLAGAFLDFVYPPRCVGCGRVGNWFCEGCLACAARCSGPLAIGRETELMVYSVGFHEGLWREAVLQLKFGNNRALARAMGGLLYETWREHGLRADCLIPVPLSPGRARSRGYNQAALLARELAQRSGVPALEKALRCVRQTSEQALLGAQERLRNVAHAFAPAHELEGLVVALVDDVCTTGATLGACAWAVREGGAECTLALTFTRARDAYPLRRP